MSTPDPTPAHENFASCCTVECGGTPYMKPVLLVFPPAERGNGCIPVTFQAAVCKTCMRSVVIGDFLTEDLKRTVLEVLRSNGKTDPDWSRTTLAFASLGKVA